jgi:hypothetical protein
MRVFGLMLLACGAMFVVALTGILLVLLEAIAKPLRFVNIRCVALLKAIHDQEVGP